MVVVTFEVVKAVLAFVALLAMLFDFFQHKELKYVFLAYLFLFISAGIVTIDSYYPFVASKFLFHFFGITAAGLLFAKTAHSANKRINFVRNKTRKVFSG